MLRLSVRHVHRAHSLLCFSRAAPAKVLQVSGRWTTSSSLWIPISLSLAVKVIEMRRRILPHRSVTTRTWASRSTAGERAFKHNTYFSHPRELVEIVGRDPGGRNSRTLKKLLKRTPKRDPIIRNPQTPTHKRPAYPTSRQPPARAVKHIGALDCCQGISVSSMMGGVGLFAACCESLSSCGELGCRMRGPKKEAAVWVCFWSLEYQFSL